MDSIPEIVIYNKKSYYVIDIVHILTWNKKIKKKWMKLYNADKCMRKGNLYKFIKEIDDIEYEEISEKI